MGAAAGLQGTAKGSGGGGGVPLSGGSVGGGGGLSTLGKVDPALALQGVYGQNIGQQLGIENTLGAGYDAPQLANVQQGTSVQDVQKQQGNTLGSIESQNALLGALQGQGGLGRQTALANQLQAANGVGTQNAAIQGLQNTAGMYQNVAEGKGPNPAQAMLNQATGANVANQAALMAGQRGAGANVGLMARQAAQQGAATQQQAVGQGATMQANQQLGALQGLSGTQQAIGGLGTTQAGMQQGMANQLAGQQIAGTTANTQANLANQQQLQNALGGVNNANVAAQGNVNTGNAALLQTGMQGKQGLMGGILQGAGSAIGGLAGGGEVKSYADGGSATPAAISSTPQPNGASSPFGQFLQGWSAEQTPQEAPPKDESDSLIANKAAQPDQGAALLSTAAMAAMMAAKGGLAKAGGHVNAKSSSQKAVKSGDSYDNDKVPAMLSEGEVVIPRSIMQGKDPARGAAQFVQQVLAKRKVSHG